MELIKDTLRKLYADGAQIFKEISFIEAQQASVSLVKAGVPRIPQDYAQFLSIANGLYWNGLYLYSLNAHDRVEDGFLKHPGILQTYLKNAKNPLLKNQLVIGIGIEEIITYSSSDKEYHILSNYDYRILLKLPRFFDVLYHYAQFLDELEDDEEDD